MPTKAWVEAHREHLNAYHREWEAKNKDKVRVYAANKDIEKKRASARKTAAKWRREHPEENRERSQRYSKAALARLTPEQKKASAQRSAAWKKAHPVETKAATKRYSQKHLDRLRAKGRRYAADNAERMAERSRQWRQDNPEKNVIKSQRRRARVLKAPGQGVTTEQWQELQASYLGMCAYCYATSVPLEMDHVDPISRGGAHDISNIAPACTHCNVSKHNSPLIVWLARKQRRSA